METQASIGFYQVVVQRVDGYLQHINVSSKDVIRYVTIFGICFLVGVLLKRYGMMIISWLIGIIFVISMLHYLDLIVVQKTQIKIFLHIEQVHTLDDVVIEIRTQIQKYVIESLLGTVAVILGFKLG